MLVLSRKRNEAIVINDNITIVVVDIRGDKVRLGIEAPSDVSVHRQEVWLAIQREKKNERPGLTGRVPIRQPARAGQGSVDPTEALSQVGKQEGGESSGT